MVMGRRRIGAADQLHHTEQIRNAAHQICITHATEKTLGLLCLAGVHITEERRLPDLHGMHASGLFIGREHHHASIFEQSVTVPIHRIAQGLFNHVVGVQRHHPLLRLIMHIQHILTIG